MPSNLDMGSHDPGISSFVNQEADQFDKIEGNPKGRESGGQWGRYYYIKEMKGKHLLKGDAHQKDFDNNLMRNAISMPQLDTAASCSYAKCFSQGKSDYIAYYFNENVAALRVRETCKLYMRCKCVVDLSLPKEREVAIVLNSEEKFYMLLVSVTFD